MAGGGEDFLLKWNDHHSLFFAGAEELCREEEYTDVTLSAGASFFPAHRLVLSVCSPYFRQLFRRLGNHSRTVVHLKDVEPRHLELLLEYMYKGEIKVEESELVTVLSTAQGLEIKGLTDSTNDKNAKHSKASPAPARAAPSKRAATPPPPPPGSGDRKKSRLVAVDNNDQKTVFKIGSVQVTPSVEEEPPAAAAGGGESSNSVSVKQEKHDEMVAAAAVAASSSVADDEDDWEVEEYAGGEVQDGMDDSDVGYSEDGTLVASYEGETDEYYMAAAAGGDAVSNPINEQDERVKRNLQRHMTTHTGARPYTCQYCHKTFSDPSNRNRHERLHQNALSAHLGH